MVCVRHTAVIQPQEFAEMVKEGICEAVPAAEVLCVVVWPLLLGVESKSDFLNYTRGDLKWVKVNFIPHFQGSIWSILLSKTPPNKPHIQR
jgi:hypothetical protein